MLLHDSSLFSRGLAASFTFFSRSLSVKDSRPQRAAASGPESWREASRAQTLGVNKPLGAQRASGQAGGGAVVGQAGNWRGGGCLTGGEQADGHQQHVFLLVHVELLQAHLELDQRLQQLQSVTRCREGEWGAKTADYFL